MDKCEYEGVHGPMNEVRCCLKGRYNITVRGVEKTVDGDEGCLDLQKHGQPYEFDKFKSLNNTKWCSFVENYDSEDNLTQFAWGMCHETRDGIYADFFAHVILTYVFLILFLIVICVLKFFREDECTKTEVLECTGLRFGGKSKI